MNARRLLEWIIDETGDDAIAVSVITVLELAHGIERANTAERRHDRQRFLTELIGPVPPVAVTTATALRAGRIDGESRAKGISIPLSDLLIGVTALELNCSVVTRNVRHFRLIPNLPIRSL